MIKKTHRPDVTKSKGIINLASSIQLLTLTTLSASTLGPIGFAAAAGTSFLLSLDEGIRQLRRLYSPLYFCLDNLAELDKIEGLIEEKTATLKALRALPAQDRFSRSGRLALKLAYSAQEALLQKREELREDIKTQLDRDMAIYPEGNGPLQTMIQRYSRHTVKHPACDSFILYLQRDHEHPKDPQAAKEAGRALDLKIRRAFFYATADSLIWGVAFTGMLLTCIPGMQIPALACIAIAATLFLLKTGYKLATKPGQINRFFKMQVPEVGSEGQKLRSMVTDEEEKEPPQAPPHPKGLKD